MLSYFVIVFWLFFFNVGQLISYQDQVNCWMGFSCKITLSVIQIWWSSYYSSSSSRLFISYLLQDFSSSHPNLVITFQFGNYSVRVNCHEQLYSTLARDRVANFLRSSLLISYWLLGFVFASLLEVWIELLSYWSRLIDFTSSSSRLFVGYLLLNISLSVIQIWSSHFCLAIIVWESIVANCCIRHWHETGLGTF